MSKVTQTANDKKAYLYHSYKLCGINISLQNLKGSFPRKTIRTWLTSILHHLRRRIENESLQMFWQWQSSGRFGRASERVLLPQCVLYKSRTE